MTNYNKSFTIRDRENEITGYLFLDTSQTEYYRAAKRTGFSRAVSWTAVSYRDGTKWSMNYPVVFDDYITSNGSRLEPIEAGDIPAPVKTKMTLSNAFERYHIHEVEIVIPDKPNIAETYTYIMRLTKWISSQKLVAGLDWSVKNKKGQTVGPAQASLECNKLIFCFKDKSVAALFKLFFDGPRDDLCS